MEYRQLGGSGFKVPVLSLGTGTFGGSNEFFKAWGASDVAEATRLVDICLEAGLNMFDTADIYSDGLAEEILGQAIKGRRDQVDHLDQGDLPGRPRPQRRGLVALSSDQDGRGQPEAAWYRLHRPLPASRIRRPDADRRGAGHARRPGPGRQDPLHRLLELLGLAPDEVTGRLGEIWPGALRCSPGVLLADRPRITSGSSCRWRSIRRWERSSGARSVGDGSPARSGAASRFPRRAAFRTRP